MKTIRFYFALAISLFIINLSIAPDFLFGQDFFQSKHQYTSSTNGLNLSSQSQQGTNSIPQTTQQTVNHAPPQKAPNQDNTIITIVLILIYCSIVAFTCYKKHKNELIIFSSFTDIAVTFTFFGTLIVSIFLYHVEKTPIAIIALVIMAIVCIACFISYIISTFNYNTSILYSLLSIFTKVSVSIIFILFMIAALGRSERKKGERRDSYERRVARERAAHAALGIGLYTAFVYFSTTETSFVPIKKYIKGQY